MSRLSRIGASLAAAAITLAAVIPAASAAPACYGKSRHAEAHRLQGHCPHVARWDAGRTSADAGPGPAGAAAFIGREDEERYGDAREDYPYEGPGFAYRGYPPAPFAYGGYGYGIQVY